MTPVIKSPHAWVTGANIETNRPDSMGLRVSAGGKEPVVDEPAPKPKKRKSKAAAKPEPVEAPEPEAASEDSGADDTPF